MRVLILEALSNLERKPETLTRHVSVAREHGDLRLSILTREGVHDLLPYEEIPAYNTQGGVERRAMELLMKNLAAPTKCGVP